MDNGRPQFPNLTKGSRANKVLFFVAGPLRGRGAKQACQ